MIVSVWFISSLYANSREFILKWYLNRHQRECTAIIFCAFSTSIMDSLRAECWITGSSLNQHQRDRPTKVPILSVLTNIKKSKIGTAQKPATCFLKWLFEVTHRILTGHFRTIFGIGVLNIFAQKRPFFVNAIYSWITTNKSLINFLKINCQKLNLAFRSEAAWSQRVSEDCHVSGVRVWVCVFALIWFRSKNVFANFFLPIFNYR